MPQPAGVGNNREILTCHNLEISVKHQLASAGGVLWHFYAVDKIIRHRSEATIFTHVVQRETENLIIMHRSEPAIFTRSTKKTARA